MKSLNQELLTLIQEQATHLDTFVAGRAKRFNVKLSGRASKTNVDAISDGMIRVEVMARPSIRKRDGGFGKYYNKGVRQNLIVKAIRRRKSSKPLPKQKKRKKANIINRLMFAMMHNIQRLGIKKVQDVVITNISEPLKKK